MMQRIFCLATLLGLIGLVVVTLSPGALRPASPLPVDIERGLALALVTLVAALAFPRRIWLVGLMMLILVFGLEWAQTFIPDRHGHGRDILVKAVGAILGLGLALLMVRFAKLIAHRS